MKILVLGDLHAGVNDGSNFMAMYQLDTLEQKVLSYCVNNNINEIIQTGDLFDVRRSTNTEVLSKWKHRFFDKLEHLGINLRVIVGNHDMFHKNTLHPNSIYEHFNSYNNIIIYEEPTQWVIENKTILFVPWLCEENQELCLTALGTKANICIAHPEITGANMGGTKCSGGLSTTLFKNFDLTVAGHFHIKGDYPNNVYYVGTPYQLSWADYSEDKGFHILDTETSTLEFIKLDNDLYYRISYNEDDIDSLLKTDYYNKIVKVVVDKRTDFEKWDSFIQKLELMKPHDLKIIEPLMDLDGSDSDVKFNGDLMVKSTEELITEYSTDLYPDKTKLTEFMLDIHSEARNDSI